MTALPIQKIWMARNTRVLLKEYAWDNRTTMGDVIRAAVEDVRKNPGNLAVMSEHDEPSEVQVSVKEEHEAWRSAREAATSVGLSLSPMVRRRIRKMLSDGGYM